MFVLDQHVLFFNISYSINLHIVVVTKKFGFIIVFLEGKNLSSKKVNLTAKNRKSPLLI